MNKRICITDGTAWEDVLESRFPRY